MSDILEVIKSRRSIRKFNENPIDQEKLEKIVEAGRWAPTGSNSQSVHFTVIQNKEILSGLRDVVRDAFAEMELKEDMYISFKNAISASQKGTYIYDYNAPVLIVVSNEKGYPNGIADAGCAIENMMLEATSLGMGACWINQLHWLDENASLRNYLDQYGIAVDETICASVAVGNHDMNLNELKRKGMRVTWKK